MSSSLIASLLILLVNLKSCVTVWGFHSQHYKYSRFENDQRLRRGKDDGTCLFMGKLRSRQAELQRKMKLAKEQAREKQSSVTASDLRLTDEEMKEQNDRKRFDDLLKSSSTSITAANGDISDNYLTDAQEEETIDAYSKLFFFSPVSIFFSSRIELMNIYFLASNINALREKYTYDDVTFGI